MNFLKKIINLKSSKDKEIENKNVHLSLDDSFVHNFIQKGGKFLYCINEEEVLSNFKKIIKENDWNDITVLNDYLLNLTENQEVTQHKTHNTIFPFFTTCEHLIADSGDILFSSNQLSSLKLYNLSKNFIVYATTSQLVKNIGEGLTGIKSNFKGNIPTNISSVRNYNLQNDDDVLNYGNNNSKHLYLLLFENL